MFDLYVKIFIKQYIDFRFLNALLVKICTELADCVFKKSMFIGYVNKVRSNFRHLQTHVLITWFKAYCCSFYGSQARSYGNLTPLELINAVNHGT